MLKAMAKPALGRGLGALLGGNPIAKPTTPEKVIHSTAITVPAGSQVLRVALDKVVPCPFQPRKTFEDASLQELADSIREQGIVQPLIVRERKGHYELIAGERRWRAARMANLTEVPIIVREADDASVLELALIENLQRENLNPIEEAEGYAQLMDHFKLTQEVVAAKVGKSRAAVANALRLLKLQPAVSNYVKLGKLSVGHAKALLGITDPGKQKSVADRVLADNLNVRQAETLVAKLLARDPAKPNVAPPSPARDVHIINLETKVREKVGTKVHLRYDGGKGSLEMVFYSDAELQRLLELIGISVD